MSKRKPVTPSTPSSSPTSPSLGQGVTKCIYFREASIPKRLAELLGKHSRANLSNVTAQLITQIVNALEAEEKPQSLRAIEFSAKVFL